MLGKDFFVFSKDLDMMPKIQYIKQLINWTSSKLKIVLQNTLLRE